MTFTVVSHTKCHHKKVPDGSVYTTAFSHAHFVGGFGIFGTNLNNTSTTAVHTSRFLRDQKYTASCGPIAVQASPMKVQHFVQCIILIASPTSKAINIQPHPYTSIPLLLA